MRRVIAENGADSAMVLMWVDMGSDKLDEARASFEEAHADEAVTVVARDAKNYLGRDATMYGGLVGNGFLRTHSVRDRGRLVL